MIASFYVFLGGGLGAVTRFWLSKQLNQLSLPYGTLVSNLIGCLCIGLAINASMRLVPDGMVKITIVTGFLGGLTTFSTFSMETTQMLRNTEYIKALIYVTMNLGLGVFLTYLCTTYGDTA